MDTPLQHSDLIQKPGPIEVIEGVLAECLSLMKRKNNDYAGTTNFFKNLMLCEHTEICSTEQGMMVRLSDKFSRLATLLGNSGTERAVFDESIEDTLKDIVNYSLLLIAYRRTKQ